MADRRDRSWQDFKEQMKEKRMKPGKLKNQDPSKKKEELVVQQLTAEVSGKAQKYLRVGPREFVPFKFEEVTIDNIKEACEKHFAHSVGKNVSCDVLAGEQGPSCKTIQQIPDQKLIHVRFIPRPLIVDVVDKGSLPSPSRETKRKRETASETCSASCLSNAKRSFPSVNPSKCYPKSLSVLDMIKLGKIVDAQNTTLVHMYSFDMELMTWSKVAKTVEFIVEKQPLGQGGFRNAYNATSRDEEFKNSNWVIKKYLPEAVATIQATNQTVEDHNKKVVQMHMLARNFALQLKETIVKDTDSAVRYGQHLRYKKIFLGMTDDGESVTVEEFVDGTFVKYINNNGISCVEDGNVIGQKAQCLSHFSYEKSGGKLMVVDLQGSSYDLYDPEIATSTLCEDNQFLFCTGNLSTVAINNFISKHKCSKFCNIAGLSELDA